MGAESFKAPADVYDALIDWPKRLDNEAPFYRALFERVSARCVLDAACGSGRHAALFRDWGLQVVGADVSDDMLAQARARFGESDALRWVKRSFDSPQPTATFDAAICVGNSLALAPDLAAVERAIAALLGAVRLGGCVVLHVLNLWRLPDGPVVWQKFRRVTLDGVDHLLIKGVHRVGARGFVELLDFPNGATPPRIEQPAFLGLCTTDLARAALHHGASAVEFYGDYSFAGYDEKTSVDLIAVLTAGERGV